MNQALRRLVHMVLPRQIRPRKVPYGLAKGALARVDFRFDTAFFFGRHEPDLHVHYRRLLKQGMRCFDVGMYRGWDALLFGYLTGGEVVSFDGNPECLRWTADFLAPSGVKVRLVEAYLTDGAGGGATLDQAAVQHFMPDFIKMDVEGAEASVLRGAKRILAERHPALVIETHGAAVEAECVSLLKRYGYEPIVIERSRGMFSEARSLEHNRWLVCEGRALS